MNKKELKKVSRAELLEMLLEQRRRADALEAEVEGLKGQLEERTITIENAGSIAEASLALNDIFSEAQQAADVYLDNVRKLAAAQKDRIAKEDSDAIARQSRLEMETKMRCEQMIEEAKLQSKAYWDEVREKMDLYYQAHMGLKEILERPITMTQAIDDTEVLAETAARTPAEETEENAEEMSAAETFEKEADIHKMPVPVQEEVLTEVNDASAI